ncbi:unnamed protein product, partial [Diplocarpon coronariae]
MSPLIYLLFVNIFLAAQVLGIWPAPQSASNGSSVLWIKRSIRVSYDCSDVGCNPSNSLFGHDTKQA